MAMVGWNLFKHPEEKEGESFLGNTMRKDWPKAIYAGLTTIRIGTQAFDIYGKSLDQRYAPIFISLSEHSRYEALMMERDRK